MKPWLVSFTLMLAATLPLLATATPPTSAAPDPVGRYLLVGKMETASELELRKDGRFSWLYSVGSLDMQAEGKWKRLQDFVVLKADGVDTEIAKVFQLKHVGRIDEWLPRLSADHPLRKHPNGIAVRLFDVDGYGPSSFLAFARSNDGQPFDLQGESLGETDRWFFADAAPGTVVDKLQVLIAAKLSREIDVTLKSGDVAEIAISPAALGDQERFLMMTLEIGKDGTLTPDEERFLERPARYVRY